MSSNQEELGQALSASRDLSHDSSRDSSHDSSCDSSGDCTDLPPAPGNLCRFTQSPPIPYEQRQATCEVEFYGNRGKSALATGYQGESRSSPPKPPPRHVPPVVQAIGHKLFGNNCQPAW